MLTARIIFFNERSQKNLPCSIFLALKMDFILSEAEENTPNVHFSDEDIKEDNDNSDFIDDAPIEQESRSFYGDLTNLEHYS